MKVDILNTDKKYDIIYADPPWAYNDKNCSGAAAAQYETMSLADIQALPINESNSIDEVMKKCCFFGLGRWTRGNSEPCLIAVKGKPSRISPSVGQLVFEPLTRHSAKPTIVRDKITTLIGDKPRIELFARQYADGWDCWGNEV